VPLDESTVPDRYWFFTWRTYGTWLPGEEGFVGFYRPRRADRIIVNAPGESTAPSVPALAEYARRVMTGRPVQLESEHAGDVLAQLRETADFRGWNLRAVAVLADHVHLVVGVPGDPEPSEMLRDWKAYTSRALTRRFGQPSAPRWWVDGGSKQRLRDDPNVAAAVRYVSDQSFPLVVWVADGEQSESINQ
jgi:REP element-mobilizing transposase RayT